MNGDDYPVCFLCGRTGYTEEHHIMHGTANRKIADQYKDILTVRLCRKCHSELHDRGYKDDFLKGIGQFKFEQEYGHEKWMQLFNKNYL